MNTHIRPASEAAVRWLESLGELGQLLAQSVRQAMRRPFEMALTIEQMNHLGVNSLSVVVLTALFTGMVLALQTSVALERFGANMYIGEIVAISLVRELGPVLTALMVGGRVGAGMTAELGSMAVTEQIDALRAMGSNPVKKLVVPRIAAITLMLPVLTVVADAIGIIGGMFIAVFELKHPADFYLSHALDALTFNDIFSGLGKTFFFGLFIGVIGCYNGMTVTGGATGVGRATTNSVVAASITILISDYFLTKLFMIFTL
jgi:phospholipid/cholesterol/gamma-HCH transport system permease protein